MNARCNGDVCEVLATQPADEAMKCTKPGVVDEDIDGCKSHLLTVLGRSYWFHLADNMAGLTDLPGNRTLF